MPLQVFSDQPGESEGVRRATTGTSPASSERIDSQRMSPAGGVFHTTHWSVVLAASEDDSEGAAVALEQLCRAYWMPVFVYARRSGWNQQSAEDLTQEFFHRLLD